MCYFAIVEIPDGVPALPATLQYEPNRWPGLTPASADRRLLVVSDGQCSCAIYRSGRPPLERLRAKYERRGWSHGKIERALSDHNRSRSIELLPLKFEAWLCEVASRFGHVHLLVHWDSSADLDAAELPARSLTTASLLAGEPLATECWVSVQSAA